MSPKKSILFIAALILAVAGMAFYTKGVIEEKMKFYPEKVFTAAFDEPFNRATEFEGKRVDGTQYEAYLRFKYPHEAKPLNESQYKTAWVGEAQSWFQAKYPGHPGLQEINRLKFRKRIANDRVTVTNEWLIYNPRTDDHYYRIWGTAR
ncbi:hypothetical protein KBI23_14090 [bacterium]|nr:hypothetical protein [bacterium]MBP9808301.1 hypothetical protein [bacterium]